MSMTSLHWIALYQFDVCTDLYSSEMVFQIRECTNSIVVSLFKCICCHVICTSVLSVSVTETFNFSNREKTYEPLVRC